MKKSLFIILLAITILFCGCGQNESSGYDSSNYESSEYDDGGKISDSEIESIAVQTLYAQLLAYEENYDSIDAGACRYEISNIERDDGQVEVYGRVVFYDKYGGVTSFGGDYQRNFTIHMTEWGSTPWCELH